MSEGKPNCTYCNCPGAEFKCGKCKKAFYCQPDCQKFDWPGHKQICGHDPDKCKRCEKSISTCGDICRVPHPISSRRDGGAEFSGEGCKRHYICEACGGFWTEVTKGRDESTVTIVGKKWCFEGDHSSGPILSVDKRKVTSDEVNLNGDSPDLQTQLDTISSTHPNVKKLTIHAKMYNEKSRYSFDAVLPELDTLIIDMVRFEKFILTDENVPKLSYLHLTNFGDVNSCRDFNICASNLKHIEIYFMESEDIGVINNMLQAATKLQVFKSRKLQVFGDENLIFNSNSLKEIKVTRSDCLKGITIWAPKLRLLDCTSSFDIEEIEILENHELRSKIPDDTKFSKFVVDLTNVCHSPDLLAYLHNHPRVKEVIYDSDF